MNDYYYRCLPEKTYQLGDYVLEAVQPENIERIRQWRNEQMDVLRQTKPISKEEQVKYYENHVWPEMDKNQPGQILLSLNSDNKLIGYGGLVHIGWGDLRGEMSFLVDGNRAKDSEVYQNDMSNFITVIREVFFDQLSFNRLFTETFGSRRCHIDILKENGFLLEGRLREHVKYNKGYSDSLIHSIIRNDFS